MASSILSCSLIIVLMWFGQVASCDTVWAEDDLIGFVDRTISSICLEGFDVNQLFDFVWFGLKSLECFDCCHKIVFSSNL